MQNLNARLSTSTRARESRGERSTISREYSSTRIRLSRTFKCRHAVDLPSKLKVMPLSLSVVYTHTFIFQLVGSLKTSAFFMYAQFGLNTGLVVGQY